MIVIYVGDITDRSRTQAQNYDPAAHSITQTNSKNLEPGVYYLSLGDLNGIPEFISVLSQADKIVYVGEDRWSDTKNNFSYMKHWTEFYLCYFYSKKIVSLPKFDLTRTMLELADKRVTQHSQLWVSGCSISHGVGVENYQRYGQLIADHLDLPVSFLTAGGSSIEWAADQILRSDIRPKDKVVWGITSDARVPYYTNNKLIHVHPDFYKNNPKFNSVLNISALDEPNMIYKATTKIHQVINFCKKINAELYLGGFLVSSIFAPYLVELPNYIQFYGMPHVDLDKMFLDYGTDDLHPGPITHQWYADNFLTKITNA